jgi:hypothetical protein
MARRSVSLRLMTLPGSAELKPNDQRSDWRAGEREKGGRREDSYKEAMRARVNELNGWVEARRV